VSTDPQWRHLCTPLCHDSWHCDRIVHSSRERGLTEGRVRALLQYEWDHVAEVRIEDVGRDGLVSPATNYLVWWRGRPA
jgi:hypothetical protein